MLFLDRRREPGGVDLAAFDSGIVQAFLDRLDDQVLSVHVPPLAELGAAHAQNGHLVLDSPRHVFCPRFLPLRP